MSKGKDQYGRHHTQHNNIHQNDTPHKRLTCDAQNKGHSAKLTLSIIMLCHCAVCRSAEGHVLFIIMLNVVMLSVVMLSVVILSVVMLSVVMLSVMAPKYG